MIAGVIMIPAGLEPAAPRGAPHAAKADVHGRRDDVDVMEFLIRTRVGHDWPAVHRDRLTDVLTPTGWNCSVLAGRGDHRLRCVDAEIAFAADDAGWLVSIDGSMAQQFVAAVTAQVEYEMGEPIEWLQIT